MHTAHNISQRCRLINNIFFFWFAFYTSSIRCIQLKKFHGKTFIAAASCFISFRITNKTGRFSSEQGIIPLTMNINRICFSEIFTYISPQRIYWTACTLSPKTIFQFVSNIRIDIVISISAPDDPIRNHQKFKALSLKIKFSERKKMFNLLWLESGVLVKGHCADVCVCVRIAFASRYIYIFNIFSPSI